MIKKLFDIWKKEELKRELLDNNESRCFDVRKLTTEELNALMA